MVLGGSSKGCKGFQGFQSFYGFLRVVKGFKKFVEGLLLGLFKGLLQVFWEVGFRKFSEVSTEFLRVSMSFHGFPGVCGFPLGFRVLMVLRFFAVFGCS